MNPEAVVDRLRKWAVFWNNLATQRIRLTLSPERALELASDVTSVHNALIGLVLKNEELEKRIKDAAALNVRLKEEREDLEIRLLAERDDFKKQLQFWKDASDDVHNDWQADRDRLVKHQEAIKIAHKILETARPLVLSLELLKDAETAFKEILHGYAQEGGEEGRQEGHQEDDEVRFQEADDAEEGRHARQEDVDEGREHAA